MECVELRSAVSGGGKRTTKRGTQKAKNIIALLSVPLFPEHSSAHTHNLGHSINNDLAMLDLAPRVPIVEAKLLDGLSTNGKLKSPVFHSRDRLHRRKRACCFSICWLLKWGLHN
jgi:hypothetical protein